ncbi:MAG: beta-galactosidase [Clostridia bacterium]|nr:beta-galactosidase [Clostridia bacterium]
MIPRSEYPRPQLVRDAWINLNGEWDFEIDNSMCGEAKGFQRKDSLAGKITVPFCPESKLSGIGNTDFMLCVWYRRDLVIPEEHKGKKVILHFGAVDYLAKLHVNGHYVGEHRGGYTPFSFDITPYLNGGKNNIALTAYDDIRSRNQPAGKQSMAFNSHGCFYTRTTGIWQTVWVEFVGESYIKGVRFGTDTSTPAVNIKAELCGDYIGCTLDAEITYEGKPMGKASVDISGNTASFSVALAEKHLWEVGCGRLYDVVLTLKRDGNICDRVSSYFGMRTVCLDKRAFKINGKTVFGRFVLDQGFYPDGIYTAPTDEDLKNDIVCSMQLGFNGARLHEKIFEPRFLYWADKLGYLVWGEHGNWGLDVTEYKQIEHFLPEWVESVQRDINHPSIIGWCPFNETWDSFGRKQNDMLIKTVYRITKALDNTRPVIDVSGAYRVESDVYDVHDYTQSVEEFKAHFPAKEKGSASYSSDFLKKYHSHRQQLDDKAPLFISEYGGIGWSDAFLNDYSEAGDAWSYGNAPKTKEEFIARYKGLTDVLLDNPYIFGFCYTQLYDVEQEMNGLMTYGRKFKFDPAIIHAINSRKAAIEE